MDDAGHRPVLVEQVLELLDPRPGQVVLDCTVGRGGHAARIVPLLGASGGGGRYIGLDVDADNVHFAVNHVQPGANDAGVDLTVLQANFTGARAMLDAVNVGQVDMILADLGFASNQMDNPERGFSFRVDGPLDMRLDRSLPTTAGDLVNSLDQNDLADLLYHFGQERLSRKIARKIIEERARGPMKTTGQLARIARWAYGPRASRSHIDPATRTFMALRIAVNGELDALDHLLAALPDLLRPLGRVGIISFHSLEDRRVKQTFAKLEKANVVRRLTRKPVTATEEQAEANPRCRSAKLRVAQRLIDPQEVAPEVAEPGR